MWECDLCGKQSETRIKCFASEDKGILIDLFALDSNFERYDAIATKIKEVLGFKEVWACVACLKKFLDEAEEF